MRRLLTSEVLKSNRIVPKTAMAFADNDLCLVKECRELDSSFDTEYTTKILSDVNLCNPKELSITVESLDKEATPEKCIAKATLIAKVIVKGINYGTLLVI